METGKAGLAGLFFVRGRDAGDHVVGRTEQSIHGQRGDAGVAGRAQSIHVAGAQSIVAQVAAYSHSTGEDGQIGISLTSSCKCHNTPLLDLHAKNSQKGGILNQR